MARPKHLRVRIRLGLLALVVGALAVTGVAPAQQVFAQRKLIEQERVRLAALTEQNDVLESRLARGNDPGYVEKLAREQLGLVRPGETSYVVLPGPPLPEPVEADPPPTGLLQKVTHYFRNLF